jgi:hypothetical protein
MHDEILKRLRESNGVSSVDLARDFLKFINPVPALAERAVFAIIGKDRRCVREEDGLWRAAKPATGPESVELRSMTWRAIHVLTGQDGGKIFHLSAWSVFPEPSPSLNCWLEPMDKLSEDERSTLTSNSDLLFSLNARHEYLNAISLLCNENPVVFLSSRQFNLFNQAAATEGVSVREDVFLISHFFGAAEISLPKPLTLESCYRALFEREPVLSNAGSYGRILSECMLELVERLAGKGIVTLADFAEAQSKAVEAFDFSGKNFSYKNLLDLPQKPGVYAFSAKSGDYLYIGKTTGLRRRTMGYFRASDESPAKLERLRRESFSLTTYICGSELESLIYEYRLIKKHSPVLNSQTDINERKGDFKPINDCIILLPATQENKVMSFWFRRNQKILLRTIDDLQIPDNFLNELDQFFFSKKLATNANDFPEQEIAVRWIKCHEDELVFVPVSRMKDSREIADSVKACLPDVLRMRP